MMVIGMFRGKITIALLVLLIIPLLTAAKTAEGQSYTTVTTVVTENVTHNEVSTVTVATSTISSAGPQSRLIFSGAVTIPATHGVCGQYFVQEFNASAGTLVSGTVTSDTAINFYLLTDASFHAWTHQIVAGGTCTPANPLLITQSVSSYNFSATITSDGKYDMVLNNLSHSAANAELNAISTSSISSLVTLLLYSTLTQSSVLPMTYTSIQVQAVQPPSDLSSNSPTLILGALLAVIIIAIILYRRKTKSRGT